MMNFWRSAAGIVEVELTSAEPGLALDAINRQNISVFQVAFVGDLTVRFRIRRADFSQLRILVERRGEHLRICERFGLYWRIKTLIHRKLLVSGLMLLLFLVVFVPTRVLFVQVEGNRQIPTRQILAAAEESGISFWASRREVRSEKVKNELLSLVPGLQWAGVNTRGCVAVISVRERTTQEETERETGVSSIIAARDGVIDTCTATRGNLICAPGQAVKAGQVLISGYTDCGIFLRAARAEGEVYALTRRDLRVVTPTSIHCLRETGEVKRKYSLLIGKKRINLWKDSGIWDTTCGRMYEEYYITLPGGFTLPVALAVETYIHREMEEAQPIDAEMSLSAFAARYLTDQMVAGQIRSSSLSYLEESGIGTLTASYVCREMIGRVQQEQIGE